MSASPAVAGSVQVIGGGARQTVDIGQREVKVGALAELRFHPDSAPVARHHFLADRESHAVAGALRSRMKAPKNAEDLFGILGFDTDAVVTNGDAPIVFPPFG